MVSENSTTEILDDTESQYHDTSSSSIADFISMGKEIKKREGFFNGDTLSLGFTKVYGHHWNKIPPTTHELSKLENFKDVLNLIEGQKVYHINGIMREFNVTRHSIDVVQGILTRRQLLIPIIWEGKSKGMWGMKLMCTQDCTEDWINSYLIDYRAIDELKYLKEKQRAKPSKSPEELKEIWKGQSDAAKELKTEENRKIDELIDWCDESPADMHKHLKFCEKAHRT